MCASWTSNGGATIPKRVCRKQLNQEIEQNHNIGVRTLQFRMSSGGPRTVMTAAAVAPETTITQPTEHGLSSLLIGMAIVSTSFAKTKNKSCVSCRCLSLERIVKKLSQSGRRMSAAKKHPTWGAKLRVANQCTHSKSARRTEAQQHR